MFVIAVVYACSDELHQTFVGGRSGRPLDVLIDSIGIVLAVIICGIAMKKQERRNLMDSNKQYIELTGSNKQYLEVVENAFQNNELAKYGHLMMQYQCAMLEVKTKLDVLNTELSYQTSRNPLNPLNAGLRVRRALSTN